MTTQAKLPMCDVYVETHERQWAIEAYSDFLTDEQKDQIDFANELYRFRLTLDYATHTATVVSLGT